MYHEKGIVVLMRVRERACGAFSGNVYRMRKSNAYQINEYVLTPTEIKTYEEEQKKRS